MPVSEPGGYRVRSPMPEPDPDVWGLDTNWILQFDNVIKHPGGKFRGCHCDVHDRTRSLDSGTELIRKTSWFMYCTIFITDTVERSDT